MRREEEALVCARGYRPEAVDIGSPWPDLLKFDLGPQALEKLAHEPGNGFLSMADGGAGRVLTWNLNEGLAQVDDAMDGRDVHKTCVRRYHSMNFRKPDWIRVAGL